MKSSLPLLLLALCPSAGRAQMLPRPLPVRSPSPLLFVRFAGVEGMRATFYQGQAAPRELDTPAVVGMRPGYIYRVELSNFPGHPGVSLYPTLEVVGTLHLPPRASGKDFPAPITLREEDIETALRGGLVTKILYLEHPDRAIPSATTAERFIEIDRPANRDLFAEARDAGRLMLVLRLGQRPFTRAELMRQSIYGTLLYPDETSLGRPTVPPRIRWAAWPAFDPLTGKRLPAEEYLHDGGDRGTRAGIGLDGRVGGLDPEDTVAEFTDSRGRRHVTHSNRVCLLVPRFVTLRKVMDLGSEETVSGVERFRLVRDKLQLERHTPPLETLQPQQLRAARGRLRPSGFENLQASNELLRVKILDAFEMHLGLIELLGTQRAQLLTDVQRIRLRKQLQFAHEVSRRDAAQEYEQVEAASVVGVVKGGAQVVSSAVETRDLTVCCHEVPRPPDKPLVLVKCADRDAARPGEVVTFSLKYSNLGGRPITSVAVSDSLSPRLEYVEGSVKSDRNAVFTFQDNGAGSVILRWEVDGVLLPGEAGRITFQARVR